MSFVLLCGYPQGLINWLSADAFPWRWAFACDYNRWVSTLVCHYAGGLIRWDNMKIFSVLWELDVYS